MKINGLKNSNYWSMQFFFNYCVYVIIVIIFVAFGILVFRFDFFVKTSKPLLFIILNGWGIVQISSAFLASVFMNKASTANIVGYGASIYLMIIAQAINTIVYPLPAQMPYWYNIIPSFTFSRVMFFVTNYCLHNTCYTTL